jgi:hypothetical protein
MVGASLGQTALLCPQEMHCLGSVTTTPFSPRTSIAGGQIGTQMPQRLQRLSSIEIIWFYFSFHPHAFWSYTIQGRKASREMVFCLPVYPLSLSSSSGINFYNHE